MFYRVEIVKAVKKTDFNPNIDDYSDKIVKIIDEVNCGGSLFEHMALFEGADKKKFIGNGIQLFGYYRRVQPYIEIKNSMIVLISDELDIPK